MRSRRTFLGLVGGTVVVVATPIRALADDGSFDISYLWAPHLDDLLDYREVIADVLGPEVASGLVVVRGGTGNWGLLLDRTETGEDAAKALAREQNNTLRKVLGGRDVLATALPDHGYDRTYHVRYGIHDSDVGAKATFDRVARILGRDVEASLVVERCGIEKWHVAYKRFGDRDSTERVAQVHTKYLSKRGITADVISDRFLDARWASGCVDEETALRAAAPLGAATGAHDLVYPAHTAVTKTITRRAPAADVGTQPADKIAVAPEVAPPSSTPDELPASITTPLRNAINAYIQKLRRQGAIASDETTSWYVYTLHDDRTWAAINGELQLQCASMVKPYVALAFLHRAQEGRIIYGPQSKSQLEEMIQHSSNTATNWVMDKVGGPAGVQRILDEKYGHIFHETSVTERIPQNGRTYRNRSSARDYVRFSRALWRNELPYAVEIRRIMALPGRDRLATGAPAIPPNTRVMNKTGTTSHLCGDFGILVPKSREGVEIPYAFAGIIEKRGRASSFAAWTAARARVIRGVSNLAYLKLGEHYRLG